MDWLDTHHDEETEMETDTEADKMNQNNGSNAVDHMEWQRESNGIASTSRDNIYSNNEYFDIASSRDGVGWGPSITPGAECVNSLLAEMHSRSFFSLEGISELHELIFL